MAALSGSGLLGGVVTGVLATRGSCVSLRGAASLGTLCRLTRYVGTKLSMSAQGTLSYPTSC